MLLRISKKSMGENCRIIPLPLVEEYNPRRAFCISDSVLAVRIHFLLTQHCFFNPRPPFLDKTCTGHSLWHYTLGILRNAVVFSDLIRENINRYIFYVTVTLLEHCGFSCGWLGGSLVFLMISFRWSFSSSAN